MDILRPPYQYEYGQKTEEHSSEEGERPEEDYLRGRYRVEHDDHVSVDYRKSSVSDSLDDENEEFYYQEHYNEKRRRYYEFERQRNGSLQFQGTPSYAAKRWP